MNIYGKLAAARKQFHALDLKKTGKNNFAKYSYFELGDFLIPALEILHGHGLVPLISFSDSQATLTVYEGDGDGSLFINSPMRDANLKGCHPIQNLGAVETYQRRYLWVTLMEIVEHDALDSSEPVKPVAQNQNALPPRLAAKLATKEQKAAISDFKEREILSPRRKSWCAKNWREMTEEQAGTIIDECKALEKAE